MNVVGADPDVGGAEHDVLLEDVVLEERVVEENVLAEDRATHMRLHTIPL